MGQWTFEVSPHPFRLLEQFIDLGIERVMLGGQEPSHRQGGGRVAEVILPVLSRGQRCIKNLLVENSLTR
ncbi:MAG TPA: hypothetical protein VG013_31080 [Gemmataceae bacterium]|nr:hypothetical protein [Gemmataceae bacterium]